MGMLYHMKTAMQDLVLVPWPRKLEQQQGECPLQRGWRPCCDTKLGDWPDAKLLLDQLSRLGDGQSAEPLPLHVESAGRPGSCRLQLKEDQLSVQAGDTEGLRIAFRHLRQLKASLAHSRTIPCLQLEDEACFSWRGLHLDVSRHFFATEVVCELLELMEYHGLNVFHWHLCDDQGWRLPVPALPALKTQAAWRQQEEGSYGGMYEEEDVRRVVTRAGELGITVVPEIELPGHCRAALAAYPELSCTGDPGPVPATWGVFEDVFCAGKEEVFTFLERVFDQVIRLFPGPWVHIGGDEVPRTRWQNCPHCQQRVRSEGLRDTEELQPWFVARAAEMLTKRGRRVIGWDEILEGGLDSSVALMSWRGETGGITAARAGHCVVMTPGEFCYFDHAQAETGEPPAFPAVLPLERVFRFHPLPDGLECEYHGKIMGGQANLWSERITNREHLHYMLLPRLYAMAEALWLPAGARPDYAHFLRRLAPHLATLVNMGFQGRPL